MTTRAKTIARIPYHGEKAHVISWSGLLNGDDGDPIEMPSSSDRSIQVLGTFGVGGTILWEGSNDGTNYVTLADPQGNALSKTAAAIEQVLEITRYMRPRVSAGDGTTDLTAHLLVVDK
jgi:hypothetical protein